MSGWEVAEWEWLLVNGCLTDCLIHGNGEWVCWLVDCDMVLLEILWVYYVGFTHKCLELITGHVVYSTVAFLAWFRFMVRLGLGIAPRE